MDRVSDPKGLGQAKTTIHDGIGEAMKSNLFKRPLDLLLAAIGLAICAPVFFLLAFIGSIAFRGKPFFVQQRAGQHGAAFSLVKFRTMKDQVASSEVFTDAKRLIAWGKWLRSTSLDELPQLLMVLKGEMSLVGPRPLLLDYVALYNDRQRTRLLIRPGITGWAQVNGRNTVSWQQRFELDAWYVEHQSLALDCKILWMTFLHILRPSGINAPGHATMERFTGN